MGSTYIQGVDLHALEEALLHLGSEMEASELQGLCTGVVCSTQDRDLKQWRQQIVKELASSMEIDDAIEGMIAQLLAAALVSLSDEDCIFSLLLPEDGTPIKVRAQALSGWCRGFLFGLSITAAEQDFWENVAVKEAISDIAQIVHVDFEEGVDTDESEAAYSELVEYLKIATILIFDERSASIAILGQSVHGLH